jgi:CO/xanthine dehydrogenase FAD-binding subunit
MHRLHEDYRCRARGSEEVEIRNMMRSEIDVLTPRTLDDALTLLEHHTNGMQIIAGGSDVIVQLRDGVLKTEKLLNIASVKALRYVKEIDGQIHIGALSTYSDIINSQHTQKHAQILINAAKKIGATQLQNTATIGGNLGNASPAGDSLPPLYALDATVVTRSKSNRREIPIEKFFIGYRKTALRPDELIEEIFFESLGKNDAAAFLKLGLREANAISIVAVAVTLRGRSRGSTRYNDIKIALGAVAPTIVRAGKCEKALIGKRLTKRVLQEAANLVPQETSPITDIRGSADYRKNVVYSLVYQALHDAVFGGNEVDKK